jgi:hypothetical protein
MNKPDLDSILKKARLPEIPEESLELFPRRVVARIKQNEPASHTGRRVAPRLAWAFGLILCIIGAFALGHRYGRMEGNMAQTGEQPTDNLADAKFVSETLAMFPNQVRAITEDDHGVSLVLSQKGDVPASPPIYVRICDGKHCSSVVTFSGQEIQIAGQKLTVLSDANGGIILTGNRFVWSNSERIYADNHLKIEARNLGTAAM